MSRSVWRFEARKEQDPSVLNCQHVIKRSSIGMAENQETQDWGKSDRH